MFEVDTSTVEFDLEFILWFLVEISSFVDPSTVAFGPESIVRFQVEMSRKISWP